MGYTYCIIDSNATTSLQLQSHFQEYSDFYCLGISRNSEEGLNIILKLLPDIVIVNLGESFEIQLHMLVELHRYLKKIPFFIAVSNTKAYAYEALKNGFFDYWLLPHDEFEIRKTVLKFRTQVPKEAVPSILCLKTYRDYHYIDTSEILYLKADNNSTDFFMRSGNVISTFKTLKSFETVMPKNFVRIHQSYILNTQYVSRINYGKSTCALRNVETQLPFSKNYIRRIDELKYILSKNSIAATN